MNQLQMLKRAMIAYVTNSIKAIWSVVAHPLTIVGRENCDVADYRIYGNSIQEGNPTPENPIEIQSVGELTTKNLLNYNLCYLEGVSSDKKAYMINNLLRFEEGSYTLSYNIKNASKYRLCWVIFSDNRETELTTPEVANTYAKVGLNYDYGYYHSSNAFFQLNADYAVSFNDVKITVLQPCYIGFVICGGDMSLGKTTATEQQLELGEVKTEYEPYHKYKVPIVVRGKNLLDVKKVYPNYANYEGGITFSNTNFGVVGGAYMSINWKENTQYTFSCDYEITNADSNGVFLRIDYTDGTAQSLWYAIGGNITGDKSGKGNGTTTAGKTVKQMYLGYTTSGKACNVKLTKMQVEEGTTVTEYEFYIEPQIVNIYINEPLRADRVCHDDIDFKKGIVIRRVRELILDGTEEWKKYSLYSHTFQIDFKYRTASIATGYPKCSHYINTGISRLDTDKHCTTGSSYSGLFTDYRFSTVEEFKQFLVEQAQAGTPLTIVNGLYKAYNEDNPEIEIISLPKLPQFKGATIYETQGRVNPSGIEVCYYGNG